MIKIAPSILSADFAYLARDIEKISTADYVHVDVMDGLFVPNISIGIPVVKSIRPTTDLPLDVHLMIERPVRYVEQFCDAGADIVTCPCGGGHRGEYSLRPRQDPRQGQKGRRGRQAQDPGQRRPALHRQGGADPGHDRGAGLRRSEVYGRS